MYKQLQILETAVGASGSQHLNRVNSFPSVAVIRSSSTRRPSLTTSHMGAGVKTYSMVCLIRGYTHTSIETAIDDCEALARDIERAVQSIRSPDIYNARVLSVHTDEGLFAPYGICDVSCQIDWIK